MLKEQECRCFICGRHKLQFKKGLHIDHNHKTGETRGILCVRCNTRLGAVEDKGFIIKAKKYLKFFRKKEENESNRVISIT